MRNTRLSGEVVSRRANTVPNSDDVIRYRRTECHNEEFRCSHVPCSISRALSSLIHRVALNAVMVSLNSEILGT